MVQKILNQTLKAKKSEPKFTHKSYFEEVIDPAKLGPGFYPTPKAPETKVNSFGKEAWFGYVERELKKVP